MGIRHSFQESFPGLKNMVERLDRKERGSSVAVWVEIIPDAQGWEHLLTRDLDRRRKCPTKGLKGYLAQSRLSPLLVYFQAHRDGFFPLVPPTGPSSPSTFLNLQQQVNSSVGNTQNRQDQSGFHTATDWIVYSPPQRRVKDEMDVDVEAEADDFLNSL
jgi:hypothetical protein